MNIKRERKINTPVWRICNALLIGIWIRWGKSWASSIGLSRLRNPGIGAPKVHPPCKIIGIILNVEIVL
jgi:hypothetical protein